MNMKPFRAVMMTFVLALIAGQALAKDVFVSIPVSELTITVAPEPISPEPAARRM